MSTFSQEKYSQKKMDLSAMYFQATSMRLRACKMRLDAIVMRIKTRDMREKAQNSAAVYQEWFVK